MKFNYCSNCGELLKKVKKFQPQICPNCKFEFYQNSKPTASAIIYNSQKILLVKRSISPGYGKWDIPGGFLEVDENPIDCAIREIKEELGVKIKIDKLVGIYIDRYNRFSRYTFNCYYSAQIVNGVPRVLAENSQLKWFEYHQIPKNIAFRSCRHAINDFIKISKTE